MKYLFKRIMTIYKNNNNLLNTNVKIIENIIHDKKEYFNHVKMIENIIPH